MTSGTQLRGDPPYLEYLDGGEWKSVFDALDFWDETIRRGADKDIASSTVLADDGVFEFAVVGGAAYVFELILVQSEPAGSGTPDLKLAFAISAGVFTNSVYHVVGVSPTGAVVHTASGLATATAVACTAQKLTTLIQGYIAPTADATFRLQWAQNTSSVNASRVHAESVLRYRRMV